MEGALIKLKSGVYCRTFSDLSGLVFFSARTCETFFVHQSLKRSVNFSNANIEMTVDESSPATEYNIFATAPMSGSTKTYLYINDGSSADNKTDWGSSSTYWK